MPDVAFITTLKLDDLSDLPGIAQEISDDLQQGGFDVVTVVPWQRPSLQQPAVGGLANPTVPTQTQPINPNIT
jgi:hypothetical protein